MRHLHMAKNDGSNEATYDNFEPEAEDALIREAVKRGWHVTERLADHTQCAKRLALA